jgi:glycopeptide antibiotics resistance protein
MRRLTDGSPHTRLTLAVDVLAIAAFVLIGMRSHSDAAAVSIFLRNFVPFTGSWLVVSWLVGTYRPPTPIGLIATLLIAIPIGVLLRALWVRSWTAGEVLTFALVALVFATMLMGLGRAISAVLGARLFDRRAS